MRPIHLTVGALFICLMVIGANISVWFPILAIPIGGGSIPLSLQSFFAILAGFFLGRRLGFITILVYIFIGIIGIPVFAGLKAGPMILLLPTGGFILSFLAVAYIVGFLNERSKKGKLLTYTYISLLGLMVNYILGVSFMYFSMRFVLNVEITYFLAITSMIPFFIKDFSLSILAAIFMKRVYNFIPESLALN